MNTQKIEVVRLVYQLPAEPHSPLAPWVPSDRADRFPEDRAYNDQRNRREFAAKSTAGLIKRRVAA